MESVRGASFSSRYRWPKRAPSRMRHKNLCSNHRIRVGSFSLKTIHARETLELLLQDDGYDVVSADNGPEGLALIERSRPMWPLSISVFQAWTVIPLHGQSVSSRWGQKCF